ncbi:glycosyltransferase [Gammaproteobacteria bacterium]|nr:glycosyltransferase [Gammaproteobacteria bacterium]MDC1484771.1 glycosyltransferase [Gammaproteobacteria bacterium]|tara:strand:+ start:862 stop:2001 length:1140 start_codon:yes stop_codon:yes gene_type:complete
MIIGIDASRNRSGGTYAHMVGLISELIPSDHGIKEIHVWSHKNLLDEIPDMPWLIKHNPKFLEKNIFFQLFWQRFLFKKDLERNNCVLVFNTTASSIGKFKPNVTLSQDMLPFEPGEMERYHFGLGRLRLFCLKILYVRALRFSSAVIFLTNYASGMIQKVTGNIKNSKIIPHGVNSSFRNISLQRPWPDDPSEEIKCVYVSSAAPYKHQWHVVRAIKILRNQGLPISLTLVGGGSGFSQKRLDKEIELSDPMRIFVTQLSFVHIDAIPTVLSESDMFIFASSCENMPITLIEGMASGLPIACSNRGPMPEVLAEGGTYFDPEDPASIAQAIQSLVENPSLRIKSIEISRKISEEYLLKTNSHETFNFLVKTFESTKLG